METISKWDKINVDFEEAVVLSAAADLSPVFFHGKEKRVDSMTFSKHAIENAWDTRNNGFFHA